jgi:hypothetical protein
VRGPTTAIADGPRKTRSARVACHHAAKAKHNDAGPATIEHAVSLALQRAAAAYDSGGRWETRVRAALSALLELFEERPDIARLCVVQSDSAGSATLALRDQTLAVLASRIDDGRNSAIRQPPPHAAHAVLAGAVGAIRGRLLESDPATVSDLLDPLMSFIVLPYRGAAAARREHTME